MLTTLFIVLIINSVQAQLNGEFWWLNEKLNKFRKVQPAEPVFEVLSDFDTDESAKIVFRDNDLLTRRIEKQMLYEKINNNIVWPTDEVDNDFSKAKENIEIIKSKDDKNKMEDEFVFNFPKNDKYVRNTTETVPQATKKTENDLSGEILFNDDRISSAAHNNKESQNICTYIQKKDCYQSKGVIYSDWNQMNPSDQDIVCCKLPIQPQPKIDVISSIFFPGPTNRKPRHKRSAEDQDLNQRNFLLLRKFSHLAASQKVHLEPNPTPKIVTPAEDEYVDPYWNIKNSKFQTQLNHKIVTPSYNYDGADYGDYASEVPKPGLIGLYSDHDKSPSSWAFTSNTGFTYGGVPSVPTDNNYYDDEDEDDFGYSTIDPRKVTGHKNHKRKPVKFTTVSDEVTSDAESHTINFQSNPDFQVLQGFKLLNLFRNRIYSKNSRKTTTEKNDDSKEFLGARPEDSEVRDQFFEEDQLFGGCGKAVAIKARDKNKQLSDATDGSHPWMALVVLTKSRQNVLCYATLIHPRAALTVADCVHGTSPRDVTLITGVWDLNDRSRMNNRVVDIQVHPRYKPGGDENNLAVLYWMRPLKLGTNIQPACLGEPHVGDECRLFGWGSFDQGIQTRSRWQRASIRMCDTQGINKRAKQSETFCAGVSGRHSGASGLVTSLGGPLICDIDGHNHMVGIVVSMDKGYKLMPVREFAMKANELLNGD